QLVILPIRRGKIGGQHANHLIVFLVFHVHGSVAETFGGLQCQVLRNGPYRVLALIKMVFVQEGRILKRFFDDEHFIIFEAIIDTIIHFIHHAEIENHCPATQDENKGGRKVKQCTVEQSHLHGQLIAHPIYRLDLEVGTVAFELLAEILNLGIDEVEIVCIIHMVAPYMLCEGRFINKPVFIDHEESEDIKFFPVEVHIRMIHAQYTCVEIEFHIVQPHHIGAVKRLSTYHSLDARIEFRKVERLRQVVIGTKLQAFKLVVQGILGRNDDHILALLLGFQRPEEIEAIAVRQADIEQDAVVIVERDLLHSGLEIGRKLHNILFLAQELGDVIAQSFFVFNNKQLHFR